MTVNEVNTNSYSSYMANKTTGSNSSTAGRTGTSSLGVNDFLKLMATQLANQDPSNPTDNTQFISQMAQFTSLQAMQKVSENSNLQYAASLVGKTVMVSTTDMRGKVITAKGIVSSMQNLSGTTTITVNGSSYPVSSVTQVVNTTGTANYSSSASGATINFGTMGKDFADYSVKVQYKTDSNDTSKTVGVVADTTKKQITITLDDTAGTAKLPTMTDLQNVLRDTWTWQQTVDGKVTSAAAPTDFDSKKISVTEANNDSTKSNIVKEVSAGSITVAYS